MTEEEAKALMEKIDLECTGEDDHDPAPCPKCSRIRERIWKAAEEYSNTTANKKGRRKDHSYLFRAEITRIHNLVKTILSKDTHGNYGLLADYDAMKELHELGWKGKAVQKAPPEMPADVEMANECLSMIREKLARLIPMEHCPPMLYPEAIQSMYVWTARASKDCQVEHSWHHGDETLVSMCIKGKVAELAAKKHGV